MRLLGYRPKENLKLRGGAPRNPGNAPLPTSLVSRSNSKNYENYLDSVLD
jgi:hypothetical protein